MTLFKTFKVSSLHFPPHFETEMRRNTEWLNVRFISIHYYREKIDIIVKYTHDIEILMNNMVQIRRYGCKRESYYTQGFNLFPLFSF